MSDEKQSLTKVEKILMFFAFVFLVIGVFMIVIMIMDVWEWAGSAMWTFVCAANVLQNIVQLRKNRKMAIAFIVVWSVLLAANIVFLWIRLK